MKLSSGTRVTETRHDGRASSEWSAVAIGRLNIENTYRKSEYEYKLTISPKYANPVSHVWISTIPAYFEETFIT